MGPLCAWRDLQHSARRIACRKDWSLSGHTAGASLRSTCVAVSSVARDLLGEWVKTPLSDTAVLVSYRSKSLGAFWDGDVRCPYAFPHDMEQALKRQRARERAAADPRDVRAQLWVGYKSARDDRKLPCKPKGSGRSSLAWATGPSPR